MHYHRKPRSFGQVELFAQQPELGSAIGGAGIVQPDLADGLRRSRQRGQVPRCGRFRLPGMDALGAELDATSRGTVGVDIYIGVVHRPESLRCKSRNFPARTAN